MGVQKILLGCLIFFSAFYLPVEAARQGLYQEEPEISVGLWTKQSTIFLSSDAPLVIREMKDRKIIAKYKEKAKIYLVVKDRKIFLDNKKIDAKQLLVQLEKPGADYGIEVNKKKYRGDIKIICDEKAGLTAINRLPLEQYLYSIVPGEMPTSWPMEAVKAQAVAARTFALSSLGKHANEGYQVCATTHCQVYGGINVEMERSTKAVNDTNGLILLYRGNPISAVFHSSSGGATENSEDVWGTYLPYLRSVPDYDEGLPRYQWEKKMTVLEVQTQLSSMGYKIGNLQALEVSALHKGGKNASDRTGQGRVRTMRFIGDQGNIALTGTQVRSVLGLSSTWFDVQMLVPESKKIEVPIGMYYKKKIDVDLPPYEEKGLYTDKENIRRVHGRSGEIIVFSGFGWGHGLGLSQWGAKAMAGKAQEGNDTYFKEILNHYYQGTSLRKVY